MRLIESSLTQSINVASVDIIQANIVKLVLDKIGPADRYMIIALLKNIKGYLERFESLSDVVYDDPVITIQNLLHSIEDVNAVKQPLSTTAVAPSKATSAARKAVKAEVTFSQPEDANSPYKPPRTLFSSPAPG